MKLPVRSSWRSSFPKVCFKQRESDIETSVYQIKKGGKDQELIQSSTTPDPGYHMGK